MSKHRGALRYTDPESGRPVIDIPKDMLGAHLGLSRSKTAIRAEERWTQGALGVGAGDMRRPEDKTKADKGWLQTFCSYYAMANIACQCTECKKWRTTTDV